MPRIKLSRFEWTFLIFCCAPLLLAYLSQFRAFNSSRLAIALNPFVRAREDARSSSCQSNLKQLGLGMRLYLQDPDDQFPSNTTTQSWVDLTYPYTKSSDILRCPKDSFSYRTSSRSALISVLTTPSYEMNVNLNDTHGLGFSLQSLVRPERTFSLVDGSAAGSKRPFTLTEKSWSANAPYATTHLFGATYAFADGHVKWLSSDEARAIQFKSPRTSLYSWKLQ